MASRHNGLTLVELLIVLAVVAVVFTSAIPAFARFIQENRITASTNHLVANLQYARHQAVHRNTYVAACPSIDGQACTGGNRWDRGWIIYVDSTNTGQPDHPDDILRVVGADDRLMMHSAGRFRVRFQGHGGAYGTNLTIRVCDHDGQAGPRAVIVSNPGRIRSTRDLDPAECDA